MMFLCPLEVKNESVSCFGQRNGNLSGERHFCAVALRITCTVYSVSVFYFSPPWWFWKHSEDEMRISQ